MNAAIGQGIGEGLQNATNTLLQIQMYKQKMAHDDKINELKQKHDDAQEDYWTKSLQVKVDQGDINADIKLKQLKEKSDIDASLKEMRNLEAQYKKFTLHALEEQTKADAAAAAQAAQQAQQGQGQPQGQQQGVNPVGFMSNPSAVSSVAPQPTVRWIAGTNGPRQVVTQPGMSPEDIDTAAQALVDHKEVPSQLQLGMASKGMKQIIINKAMAKDKNYNPAQADMDFAANKMGAGAFVKNYNNLDSFHQDFELNSDYLLKLSKNFKRSDIPLINRAIVTGANEIQGNPQATQILQAAYTAGNGFARLQNPTLGGQALSDASRAESQAIVNGFQSDKQLRALLDPETGSMRVDGNNRMIAATIVKKKIMGDSGGEQGNTGKTSNGLTYTISQE